MVPTMTYTWGKTMRPKLYENLVEASYLIQLIRKIVGVSVYTLKTTRGGKITAEFTFVGFVCFAIWYSIYFYCAYIIFTTDQTILRSLYYTKLQRYGDEVERTVTMIFVLYTMWKLPFNTNMNYKYIQQLVDIDREIEKLGETINFSKSAQTTLVTVAIETVVTLVRILSIWASLANLNTPFPFEKVFHVVYSDTLALVTTAQYCTYLNLLKDRYHIVNKVLASIENSKNWGQLIAVVEKKTGRGSNMLFKDKCMADKIRSCGRIYGMLYNASETANRKYGWSIALTMIMSLILIILYLFYFMEATASGLFHEFNRYAKFLIYVFWQILYAICIIYLCVFFCTATVNEAKITSCLTHNIINSELNTLVKTEAVHLSLQVIHQLPSFTARGFAKIDYMLLLEGSRTVVTFLVILLQFAADTH